MEINEGSPFSINGKLKKVFIILMVIFGTLIQGYFTGKGLYLILH